MTDRKKQPRIQLTDRDIAIFESLSIARFLTPQAIEWLHFPEWEKRYRAWQAKGTEAGVYEVTGRLYDRLRRMRELKPPLVRRIVRPVALAASRFARQSDAYMLAEAGADILIESGRMVAEAVRYETVRERSFQTLEHSVLIGTFYAAVRARLARVGLAVEAWKGDHILARSYDVVSLRERNRHRQDGKWPIIPDAAYYVRHAQGRTLCFLEIDRGRPVSTWREKIKAYEAYRGSAELQNRYGEQTFLVQCVTTTEGQRRRLIQATGEEFRQATKGYQFMLIRDLHPLTIGDRWTVVGSVKKGPLVKVVDRLRETWEVEPAPHVFIKG